MTDTVGVHVGESHVTAVRFDASSTEPPRVVMLGDSDASTAAVVAQSEDGSVLVGDEAALITQGPRVTNPLQRASTGRIGALAAVLSFVVRRAAEMDGKAPVRLAVVVDDDWQRAARDRIVQAGVASGIADTVVVPRSAAAVQPTSVTGAAALAAGAARAGSLSSAHFVTREDLGQPITVKTPVVPVPDVPRPESMSVFVDESLSDPARPVGGGVVSGLSGEFDATQVVGSVGPGPEPLGSKTSPRPALTQAAITLGLVLLVGVVGGLLILFADNDSSSVQTTPDGINEDSTPVDTGLPTTSVSTTEPNATSTAGEPETTVSPSSTPSSTTATSTTAPTTTTTTPVAVGSPGPVTLVETGLQFDTGSVVRFGQSMAAVLSEVTSVLGPPDSATNFRASDGCAQDSRYVRWGELELVFLQDPAVAVPVEEAGPDDGGTSDGAVDSEDGAVGTSDGAVDAEDGAVGTSDGGVDSDDSGVGGEAGTEFVPATTGTFGQWYASGHTSPTGLVTRDGLGVSATVGFLEVIYGASFEVDQPVEEEELGVFSISNPASGGVINGTTSDVTPEGRVLNLWAGGACQRIFV